MKNVTVPKYARPFPAWKGKPIYSPPLLHTKKVVYLDFKGNLGTIYELL